jgi:hypothetical protein
MSTAALRAPVLLVRLRPAPRPDRSGRAPRAGCRRCARHDIAGSRRSPAVDLPPDGSALLGAGLPPGCGQVPIRCADDARECSARRHRFGAKSSAAGAILLSPGHNDALTSQTSRRPVSSLPMATCPRIEVDGADTPVGDSWRAGSVGQQECEVSDVPLSEVAGCFQDDAPVRRASRLRTASGGACCVYLDTVLTDRDRSHQNFPSALRAPLTLRRSPGATSFQQQPTREESP